VVDRSRQATVTTNEANETTTKSIEIAPSEVQAAVEKKQVDAGWILGAVPAEGSRVVTYNFSKFSPKQKPELENIFP
jgi:hypothetical protein